MYTIISGQYNNIHILIIILLMLINKSKAFIAILMSQKVIFLEKKVKDDSYCSTCIYLNAMEFLYVIKNMLKLVY